MFCIRNCFKLFLRVLILFSRKAANKQISSLSYCGCVKLFLFTNDDCGLRLMFLASTDPGRSMLSKWQRTTPSRRRHQRSWTLAFGLRTRWSGDITRLRNNHSAHCLQSSVIIHDDDGGGSEKYCKPDLAGFTKYLTIISEDLLSILATGYTIGCC